MSEYFYLDPAEIKAQCREAIDNLNEVSSKTKDEYKIYRKLSRTILSMNIS